LSEARVRCGFSPRSFDSRELVCEALRIEEKRIVKSAGIGQFQEVKLSSNAILSKHLGIQRKVFALSPKSRLKTYQRNYLQIKLCSDVKTSAHDFELRNDYLIAQYNKCRDALEKIKDREQRWMRFLVLLFTALIAFIEIFLNNITHNADAIFMLVIYTCVMILVLLLTYFWTRQSGNLRISYYRVVIKLSALETTIKRLTNIGITSKPAQDVSFKKWYQDVTHPRELKPSEVLIAVALQTLTEFLCLYKLFDFLDIKAIMILGCLVVLLGAGIFAVFFRRDRRELKKVFSGAEEQPS
jgi:protein-S-isoprenylcysteine O-methyltransferase Ste14